MRDYHIEIAPFEFLTFTSLHIDREINDHACAVVSGCISDDKAEEYRRMLLEDVWVQITAIGEQGERAVLMTGIVADFMLDSAPHLKTLTLRVMSGTWLMDGYPHFRTFQNATLTYMDVIEKVIEAYPDPGVIGTGTAYSPIGDLLVQYLETDWGFMKRIASRFGSYVTPNVTLAGTKFYVGMIQGSSRQVAAGTPYKANKAVGTFMQRSSSGLGSLQESDYLEFSFQSREVFDLWDQAALGGYAGYISKIHTEYVGEELLHTYFLRSAQGMQSIPAFNRLQAGCSFEAVVTEVKQDVVRIEVLDDENPGQSDTKWFLYSTVYSTPDGPGWYCMPEVGDHVRLHLPNEREAYGYVISAVHIGDSPDRQNPDYKSIKTIHGKELLMTPDVLVLTNNKGMSIEIHDGEGIRIISDKSILIQSKGNVTVSSEDGSLMLAGTSAVNVTQAGATMQLDDDVSFTGAKFRIH